MTVVIVFGLQRSGTNFTENLIKKNISGIKIANTWSSNNEGIWKHAYNIDTKPEKGPPPAGRGSKQRYNDLGLRIKSWYIHKNPYTWIESICTKQVDIKKTYPMVTEKGPLMLSGLNVIKLAELYRDHSTYWKRVCEQKKIFHLSYEDLIKSKLHTQNGLNAFAEFYGLPCANVNSVIIPEKVGQSNHFTEDDRNKYNEVKLKLLCGEHIESINRILDRKVIEWQGYDFIQPSDLKNHKI